MMYRSQIIRNIVLLLLFNLFSTVVFSQVLNQDAEGKSTILIEGGNIGLDITKTEAAFNYNQKIFRPKKKYPIHNVLLGGTGKSKNETGIAGLFNEGKFVPGGSLSARIGGKLSIGVKPQRDLLEKIDSLNDVIKAINPLDTLTLIRLDTLVNSYKGSLREIEKVAKYQSLTWYIDGGFEASKFYLFDAASSIDSANSYIRKENFLAGNLQAGINYQHGSWIHGLSFGYNKANNLNDLTSTKTDVNINDTVQDGIIIRNSSKETYKKSEYKMFDKFSINYDLIKIFKFGSKRVDTLGFLAFNILYFRYAMTDYTGEFRLNQKENNKVNIGTGIHFFDRRGKFLGGFYAQANNVANWDKSMTFTEKISFGVYTRFNINTIDPHAKTFGN